MNNLTYEKCCICGSAVAENEEDESRCIDGQVMHHFCRLQRYGNIVSVLSHIENKRLRPLKQ